MPGIVMVIITTHITNSVVRPTLRVLLRRSAHITRGVTEPGVLTT